MIHVIIGAPCSGKSTYCVQNAKEGDLIVDYDKLATALGSKNSHAAEGHIKSAAFEAREGAIRTALKNPDLESWIIHTSPNAEHMSRYESVGADIIELDPGYDVCMQRARDDGRPQQTFDGIEKWYSGKKGRTMEKLYKSFSAKAEESGGKISGYFSTYDRIPDSYGDIVARGAFTDTIKAREESGHSFPLCWNHDLDQIIGKVDSIEDTEKGPLVTASFFNTPLAQEKREIVKSGVVYQFSFAYSIEDAAEVTLEDGTKANELRKLDLYEVSVVPIPANPRAEVTDIKAGRRNSAKDADAIREAIRILQGVLGELDDTDESEDGEDKVKSNAAAEETEQSNPAKENLLRYIKTMSEQED